MSSTSRYLFTAHDLPIVRHTSGVPVPHTVSEGPVGGCSVEEPELVDHGLRPSRRLPLLWSACRG